MNADVLVEHYDEIATRLSQLDDEKARLVKKLRALDVLLEGVDLKEVRRKRSTASLPGLESINSHPRHPNAVRASHRISLIGAVEHVARKIGRSFSSSELLEAIQVEFPEFGLSETKHISSPLSDLVKKGVLILEQKRSGSEPNIYRLNDSGHS